MTQALKQSGPSQKYASDFNNNIFKSGPFSSLPSLCLMLCKERNIWITDSTTRKNSVGARQAEHEHRYSLAKVFYHRDFQSMSKFTKMHKMASLPKDYRP